EFPILLSLSDATVNGKRFFTGIIHDNTGTSNLLKKLQLSEDRFIKSQRFANIGVWDWDITTNDLYWSEQVPLLMGYEPGEIDVKFENFLKIIHPDDRKFVQEAIHACVEFDMEYNIEHRILCPDGGERWLQEIGDVVRDEDGNAIRMVGVTLNISARKKSEAALIASELRAAQANKAKSQFLSNMSHELRTPLNAVLGFTQLLQFDDELNQLQRNTLNDIYKAGNHLLNLINEVLDLSRIESDNLKIEIEYLELTEILAENIALIEPTIAQSNLSLDYKLDNLEGIYIYGDRTRITQVLTNLLSNAVKYNKPNGKISLYFEEKNNKVRIYIQDTGNGIPDEQQKNVFQAFNRLGAENSAIEGTGIGLVITKNLVELQSGHMGFESKEGVGTTFWVEFPCGRGLKGKHAALNKQLQTNTSSTVQCGSSELTVLYIEDNPNNLHLMREVFKKRYACTLIEADRAQQGIVMAKEYQPQIILLDINLPDMNGFDILQTLRSYPQLRNTPVFALTANAGENQILEGLNAGFNEYITKPIDLQLFHNVLTKYVNLQ
ncbi:MAG: PAS domain-containing protein, partial [Gammaproteobacteria bacterium]|nr:PAS domain-containing protein [Gammaproteobacteria bacterium]